MVPVPIPIPENVTGAGNVIIYGSGSATLHLSIKKMENK
jgi:hypothetical protein